MKPPGTILVVDDTASSLRLLTDLLEAEGHEVRPAMSGELALASVHAQAPELILLDIRMPGMDGFEVCRRLKADPRSQEIPVIFISAVTALEERVEGLRLGAVDFISKPFQREELLARVDTHLELSRLRNQLEALIQERTVKLQASEQRFRAFFDLAAVGVAQVDVGSGRFIRVNRRYCEILGYSEEQMLNSTFQQLTHPDDVHLSLEKLARMASGEIREYTLEKRYIHRDGRVVWVSVSVSALWAPGEAVNGLIVVVQDITERKRSEQEIFRLAAVVNQAGDSVVITDTEGRIIYVNPFFETLTGYRPDEVLGQRPSILKSDYQDASVYRDLWGTITSGKTWTGHFVNRRKNGSLYHEDATIFPVTDASGATLNYAAVKKDATQRIQSEEKIRKLTQLYATLSHTNEIIVRATSADELYHRICRGAVEHGGFAMAWVGLVDPMKRTVTPFCQHGDELGYLKGVRISIDNVAEGRGTSGRAIRENRVLYVNDYAADKCMAPWREKALLSGFRGSAALPIAPRGTVIGTLTLYSREAGFFDDEQIGLLDEMSHDISFAIEGFERERLRCKAEDERQRALVKLQSTLKATIQMAAATLEMRDPYTAGHQQRVAKLATAIAMEMGLGAEQIEGIGFGSLIHDIGKIYIPAEILTKPRLLTPLEMEFIRTHPRVGHEIVKDIEFPWPVAEMIRQHHERLDGSGYPDGLSGPEIILEARIITVADVVEAMSSHRPYRPGLGIDPALAEIARFRDLRYDPQVVDACIRIFRERGFSFD